MSPSVFPNDNKLTGFQKKSLAFSTDGTDNSTKSRVPDILMINKYYGLIPQKFTITSRGTACSKPSSARRTMKSSSAKPRASSGLSHGRKTSDSGKGCRSENDSPEPIKMVVIAAKGVNEIKHHSSESEDKPIDPLIGPVTKKMSVEKYKKWKHDGGGKARNLSIRTSSDIGNTLSLTNKRLPDGIGSHANGAFGECIANRRVIKIDLNNASWDEENYQITQSTPRIRKANVEQSRNENAAGESRADVLLVLDNSGSAQPVNGNIEGSSSLVSRCNSEEAPPNEYRASSFSYEDPPPTSSSESLHMKGRTEGESKNSPAYNESISILPNSEAITKRKLFTSQEPEPYHDEESISKDPSVVDAINGNCGNMNGINDKKLALFQKGGRLSNRTISFDGVVSDGADKEGFLNGGVGTETSKRRPATAAARSSNKTFTTPNNFNPPSKVIPWTQQKAAGGKPLTLAERRAKFQRTSSIHSSSSVSLEVGEEDVAEVDIPNPISQLSAISSAYRETRKPLYVMQPPEVPTMISQINPNADEDIQIEIEKVAIMLKKMQTLNHFSMSLDSGIEAEMKRKSSDQSVLKGGQSSSTLKSTESLLPSQSLNSSESESSISSVESNSSEEQSLIGGKSSSTSTASRKSSKTVTTEKIPNKCREITQSDGVVKKQINCKNSTRQSYSNSTKKISPTPTNSGSASANVTARRPPLKKAVSISCEQELLKAGGGHHQNQNEVNSSAVEKGRSSRPRTAAGLQHQRPSATGTRPSHNYSQQRVSNISSSESHNQSGAGSNAGSQGSRNRKILIKKALMEINQSSVNLRRKWGTLGRPRTAPTLNKANGAGTVSQQHPTNSQLQQKRKPLKA